jgi:dodecin
MRSAAQPVFRQALFARYRPAVIRAKGDDMADVAKVITIIGSSPESFAKAADAAVQEAGKTLRGISGADVVSMSAVVENDRISEYRTTVNIAFAVER